MFAEQWGGVVAETVEGSARPAELAGRYVDFDHPRMLRGRRMSESRTSDSQGGID